MHKKVGFFIILVLLLAPFRSFNHSDKRFTIGKSTILSENSVTETP